MKTKQMIPATLALLLVAWIPGAASAASVADLEKQFLSKIDELLPGMGAEKLEDRQEPQLTFERICFDNSTPDKQVERQALCQAMMQRVGPEVATPARVWLLRKIETIGRDEVVVRLAELMADSDARIRELARRALENNPSAKAAAALRAELDKAECPVWKVALINALAFRRDAEAVPQFVKLAGGQDANVAGAAVAALGDIADSTSVEALASLRKGSRPELQEKVVDASLRAAESLAGGNDRAKAAAIFEELNTTSSPENVRITAITGMARAKGPEAIPQLLAIINGSDERLQIVAARAAQRICGEGVTQQLTQAVEKASPDAQAVLLEMLGQRGDAAARPAVAKYIDAVNPDVRMAAVGAMRYIGNGTVVEALAKLAGQATGPERDAARDSLKWMRGQDVDDAILSQLGKAEDRANAELVRAAAVRLMKPAFDTLLKFVNDPDESVRTPVIYNIGKLGTPEDLLKVLGAFNRMEANQNTDMARDAVVRICSRISGENERVQPLTEVLPTAEPMAQIVILKALGELRGPAALEAIRGCRNSPVAPVKKAANDSLAKWGPVYCTAWMFSGPYQKEGATNTDLFDVVFPPEEHGDKGEWQPLKDQRGPAIDLEKVAKGENRCGYLRTRIVSDVDQDVILSFGSDDGLKVWLNGEVVHANNATRGLTADQDKVKVTLKKGRNILLIKSTQGSGQWAVACGVQAVEGGPPKAIEFKGR